MEKYEVNENTTAVIGLGENISKIVEYNNEYIVGNSSYEVMDNSCKYFGSSYLGRVDGSKNILGLHHKVPVVVEESSDLIFFPINTTEDIRCIWLSLKWIKDVYTVNNKTIVEFKNGKKMLCKCSEYSLKNQIMKASRLNTILNERKHEKNR